MADYNYYRIFYYVAATGSFTRAAERLGSTQPNVTRSINNLEADLKCRLFTRSNRGAALTREGAMLYAHVRKAVEEFQSGEAELSGETGLHAGTITIGFTDNALHLVLLPFLQQFAKRYPGIRIRLTACKGPEAVTDVENGSVDLSLGSTPLHPGKNLRLMPLSAFQDTLICGQDYKYLAEKKHHLAEMAEYPLVGLAEATSTREFFLQYYESRNISFHSIDIESPTTSEILSLVRYGMGIGFYPRQLASGAVKRREVFEIPLYEKIPERSICLILDSSRVLSPAARVFVENLQTKEAAALFRR